MQEPVHPSVTGRWLILNWSGASLLVSAVPQSFIDERFHELGFEGDRLWSLKRSRSNVNALAYTADKLVLPIPQREIDVNGNLRQNPGY